MCASSNHLYTTYFNFIVLFYSFSSSLCIAVESIKTDFAVVCIFLPCKCAILVVSILKEIL